MAHPAARIQGPQVKVARYQAPAPLPENGPDLTKKMGS